tara:strand:- start:894 stop:1517 length:624 start_codon:yes stop_codon:yes gene_type:complete
MKPITALFSSCSWTYGDELEEEKRLYQRFQNHIPGINPINNSKRGASNDWIFRNTIPYFNSGIKVFFVQWTMPSRTEYRITGSSKYMDVTIQNTNPKKYYEYYTGEIGEDNLLKNHYCMQELCKLYDILYLPLLIGFKPSIANSSSPWLKLCDNLPYDIRMSVGDEICANKHPNPTGHKLIAEDIYKYYYTKLKNLEIKLNENINNG